ncbi:MAG TPA: 2-keto-3-deoxygluconate permease [Candidatus Ligilactobacillus excrementavium]|nr:2-keto-3-deoxygluconate permease [Candidatus Ligilactobacillus excrementavium]
MDKKVLSSVQKIPGGIMIIPLCLGVLVNSFFPEFLKIGSFTTAVFKDGAMAFLGLFILCTSAQIQLKTIGRTIKIGGTLLILKFVLGSLLGLIVAHFWGYAGILGISPLALLAAMSNANVGVYASLAEEFGSEDEVNATSIVAINEGPLMVFLALGASGVTTIPGIQFVAICVPIVVGLILGNIDSDFRTFLAKGQQLLVPFFAFPLGTALDLGDLFKGGVSGILIGLLNIAITGGISFLICRWLFKKSFPRNVMGWFIGTTAGNAVATPAIVAQFDSAWAPYVSQATAQVATSVIVTALIIPFIASYFSKSRR